MKFEDIKKIVASNKDLSLDATLTDQYAYETLKALNLQYKNKLITKDNATRSKNKLIKRYEEQKKLDENRQENWNRQVENINKSAEIRVKLNKACKNGEISKELFLEAIQCIGLMCGDTMHYESCKKQLEGVDYEETNN